MSLIDVSVMNFVVEGPPLPPAPDAPRCSGGPERPVPVSPLLGRHDGGGTSLRQRQAVPPHPEAETGSGPAGGRGEDPQTETGF